MKLKFTDAQKMHKAHPKTFAAPSKKDLDKIKKGDYVKICVDNQERFWVEVTTVKDETITGKIDNVLVVIDLKLGDVISFEKKHVYDILSKKKAMILAEQNIAKQN